MLPAVLKTANILEIVCESLSNQIELILLVWQFISADIELLKKAVLMWSTRSIREDIFAKKPYCDGSEWGCDLRKGPLRARTSFAKQMVPSVKWLETVEEEDEGEAVLGSSNSGIRSAMNHLLYSALP